MDQIKAGRFITKKRKEQNLTQEQLAERLGVSNKTVSKWETGKCMPDYAVVKSLCEELKASVSELMDGEKPMIKVSVCMMRNRSSICCEERRSWKSKKEC